MKRHWLWLLLLIPIGLGLMRLRLDVEVLNLLPDEFPVVRGIKLYQTNFANARELIITASAADPDTAETAARTIAQKLRAETNLTAQVTWQPLWLEKPGQSAELVAYLWYNQPPEVFATLQSRLAQTNLAPTLREAQEALTTSFSPQDIARRGYDPLDLTQLPEAISNGNGFGDKIGEGNEFFASADGTFRVVFVEARPKLTDYKKCTRWVEAIRGEVAAALGEAGLADQVAVSYTGRPAFVAEISSSMESDLAGPSGATLIVIALLFYFTHRRIKPLLWLIGFLLLILGGTMALGGLVFGTLNVISLGFASILLGLAEDFAIVLYQESRSHPEFSVAQVRRIAKPGILWSTVTTCGAFLALNLGGLPGLGQLGTLVALGIALSAVVMLYAFLPVVMRKPGRVDPQAPPPRPEPQPRVHLVRWPWLSTLALLLICASVLFWRRPGFDNSPDALRPKNSPAYAAIAEIKQRLNRTQEPLWVLVTGESEAQIATRLAQTEAALQRGVSNGMFRSFTMPTTLWPNPLHQSANRALAAKFAEELPAIRSAVLEAGFTTNSLAMTENMLATWDAAARATSAFWPTNESSEWVLNKLISRSNGHILALGLINRNTDVPLDDLTPRLLALANELSPHGIYVSGWEVLGYSVFARVKETFWQVLVPMFVIVVGTLWLAFRSFREMLLSLTALLVSGLVLWAVMAIAGWQWNLLNLMALPLLLGMGVDFSIHIQLALTRCGGNLRIVRGSVGRALLLAGSTTVAGFGSLAFSSNAGMASLGKVCGTGIICAMLVSVYLLPLWWSRVIRK